MLHTISVFNDCFLITKIGRLRWILLIIDLHFRMILERLIFYWDKRNFKLIRVIDVLIFPITIDISMLLERPDHFIESPHPTLIMVFIGIPFVLFRWSRG